jgi:hypothetical protein
MTLSIMGLVMTLSIDNQHNSIKCHYAECSYAECRDYLNVMLSAVMLSVVWLSVVRQNVAMLSVAAPFKDFYISFPASMKTNAQSQLFGGLHLHRR